MSSGGFWRRLGLPSIKDIEHQSERLDRIEKANAELSENIAYFRTELSSLAGTIQARQSETASATVQAIKSAIADRTEAVRSGIDNSLTTQISALYQELEIASDKQITSMEKSLADSSQKRTSEAEQLADLCRKILDMLEQSQARNKWLDTSLAGLRNDLGMQVQDTQMRIHNMEDILIQNHTDATQRMKKISDSVKQAADEAEQRSKEIVLEQGRIQAKMTDSSLADNELKRLLKQGFSEQEEWIRILVANALYKEISDEFNTHISKESDNKRQNQKRSTPKKDAEIRILIKKLRPKANADYLLRRYKEVRDSFGPDKTDDWIIQNI